MTRVGSVRCVSTDTPVSISTGVSSLSGVIMEGKEDGLSFFLGLGNGEWGHWEVWLTHLSLKSLNISARNFFSFFFFHSRVKKAQS